MLAERLSPIGYLAEVWLLRASFALGALSCLAGVIAPGGRPRVGRRIATWMVVLGGGAIAAWIVVLGGDAIAWLELTPSRAISDVLWRLRHAGIPPDDAWEIAYGLASLAGAALVARGARRSRSQSSTAVLELALGAGIIASIAGLLGAESVFVCSPAGAWFGFPSEVCCGRHAAENLTARAELVTVCAGALVAALLWRAIVVRDARPMRALAPLVAWLIGVTVKDLSVVDVGWAFSSAEPAPPGLGVVLERAGEVADAVDLGTGILVALVTVLALHRSLSPRARPTRATLSRLAPLVATVALLALSAWWPPLHVTLGQQHPEPVWQDVDGFDPMVLGEEGEVPPFSFRVPGTVLAVAERDGTLHVFTSSVRAVIPSDGALPALAGGESLEVIVHAGATMGDLRRIARQAQAFERLTIVALRWSFHRLPERTRSRWGFVEQAARSVRGRTFVLRGPLEPGEGVRIPRVAFTPSWEASAIAGDAAPTDSLTLTEAPDDLPLERLLALGDDWWGPLILPVDEPPATARWAPTPRERRGWPWLAHLASLGAGLAIGALLGLLASLATIARELARRRRAVTMPYDGPKAWPAMPFWVSAAAIDRVCVIDDGGASYRAAAHPIVLAGTVSQRAAADALHAAVKRLARRTVVTAALVLAPPAVAVALRVLGWVA